MFFEPLGEMHKLNKGVGVNKGYDMDAFAWCRLYEQFFGLTGINFLFLFLNCSSLRGQFLDMCPILLQVKLSKDKKSLLGLEFL